jgi:hypothetical protein
MNPEGSPVNEQASLEDNYEHLLKHSNRQSGRIDELEKENESLTRQLAEAKEEKDRYFFKASVRSAEIAEKDEQIKALKDEVESNNKCEKCFNLIDSKKCPNCLLKEYDGFLEIELTALRSLVGELIAIASGENCTNINHIDNVLTKARDMIGE